MSLKKLLSTFFSKSKPTDTLDDFYTNDPAYQDFTKGYQEHCRNSGLYGQERQVISNLIHAAFSYAQTTQSTEALLAEIKVKLDVLIMMRKDQAIELEQDDPDEFKENNPDLTYMPVDEAVDKIIWTARSMIRYWEEPQYEHGLPLLEESLNDYFSRLAELKSDVR